MPRWDSLTQTEVNPWTRYPVILVNLGIFIIATVFVCIILVAQVYSIYLRWDDISVGRGSPLVSLVVNIDVALLALVAYLSFVSSLGFLGALRENICCLYCYDWMLFIMMFTCSLGFILLIIMPFLATRDLQSVASIELIERYRDNPDYQGLVDYIQIRYKCCGVTEAAYLDWNSNMYFNCSNTNPSVERCSVPPSCCREPEKESLETVLQRRFCGRNVLAMSESEAWAKVNTRNCVNSFSKHVQQQSITLCVAGVVVLCVLLLVKGMASRVQNEIEVIARHYNRHQRKLEHRARVRQAWEQAHSPPRVVGAVDRGRSPARLVMPAYVVQPALAYYPLQTYP
nr:tetraspanin-33-like [Dermacentor andersoni]